MANIITGFQLKGAVRAAALKQLEHLGAPTAERKFITTWSGDGAYAAWDSTGSVRINYPAVAENSVFSRREADLIVGYTLHELGHVVFTQNPDVFVPPRGIVFKLTNGIEDARIEHAVAKSGNALGARSAFKNLIDKYTSTHLSPDFNPTSINCAPFALALVCRAAYGDGNEYAKGLLSRIPMPHRAWYEAAAQGIVAAPLDKSGTAVAARLAEEFLRSWLSVYPDALKPPKPREEPQEEPQGETLSNSDESDEEPSGDVSDEQSGEDGDEHGGGSARSDEEGDGGESSDGDGDGDEQSDEDGETQSAHGDGSSDKGGDEPFSIAQNDGLDESKIVDPEPNVDDIFDRAAARNRDPIDLMDAHDAPLRDVTVGVEPSEAEQMHYDGLRRGAGFAALRSQMSRVLRAPEIVGWDGGAVGGRFDGRRAPRMLAGSERVFKRRWESEGIDTVVSIVVDMSGSMDGYNIRQASALAFALADIVEGARCDVEILGFRTNHSASIERDSFMGEKVKTFGGGDGGSLQLNAQHKVFMRAMPHELLVFKPFNKKVRSCASLISTMNNSTGGGTPDYETVRTAVSRLSAMPHKRKLCIVITDGMGSPDEMRKLCDAAPTLFGVDIIGFGIGCQASHFAEVYPVGTAVSLRNLGKSTLKGVIKALEQRGVRRVA